MPVLSLAAWSRRRSVTTLVLTGLLLAAGVRLDGSTRGHLTLAARADRPAAERDGPVIVSGGNGCGGVGRRFPRDPGDPPAPPTPTPSPWPSVLPSPSVRPSGSPGVSAQPSPGSTVSGHVRSGRGTVTLALADPGASVVVAQAEPSGATASPTPSPAGAVTPSASPGPSLPPDDRVTLVPGIDISHHNGDIDFELVRRAGHRYVFMKATQDIRFVDPRFLDNAARARVQGMPYGAYHFFDYRVDGTAQADHFVDRVELGGGFDDTLPAVVDIECWPPAGTSIHVLAVARLHDFVERVFSRTGRLPMIYTSARMWREVMGDSPEFGDLALWVACWRCEAPALPAGWEDWRFWQTGTVRVRRVGRLDGNLFKGTEADLLALRRRPPLIEAGRSFTNRSRVRVDLGTHDGREVRTSVDGTTWSAWRPRRDVILADLPAGEGQHQLFVQLRLREAVEAPVVSDRIVVDLTPPIVVPAATGPGIGLGVGPVDGSGPVPRLPMTLDWQASDALSGLSGGTSALSAPSRGTLTADCGDERRSGPVPEPALPSQTPVPRSGSLPIPAGEDCQLQVTERDGAGNAGRLPIGGARVDLVATDAAPSVERSVLGDEVGILATRGPDRGWARVAIDGEQAAEVDLYAPVAGGSEVVLVVGLDPGREHVVTVTPAGRASPGSSADTIAIDGLAILRRLAAGT
jgi:lysozyme